MSRATHARFLARQVERRREAKAAAGVHRCEPCGSTEGTRQYVADCDPFGMGGSVWLCPDCAPVPEGVSGK